MPINAYLREIFPDREGPFTMPEIVQKLQQLYSPYLSRSCIYRAHDELKGSDATAALVAPLDAMARTLVYSADAAQRIGRRAIRGRSPGDLAPRLLLPVKVETRLGLK